MIGHHHISADGDFVNPVRLLGEPDECRVHGSDVSNFLRSYVQNVTKNKGL
jgi:hypothetical protein